MTESDKTIKQTKRAFLKGWTQGIFNVTVVAGLSPNDGKDTRTTVSAVHDIGLPAGDHALDALKGHGYIAQQVTFKRAVPELTPEQAQVAQVGSLDLFERTVVYTTEMTPINQAQRTAAVANDPTTQALTEPGQKKERVFEIKVLTEESFEKVFQNLATEDELELAA